MPDLPAIPEPWLLIARADWDWMVRELCAAIRSREWHVRRIRALEAWRVSDMRSVGEDEFTGLRLALRGATRRPWRADDVPDGEDEDGRTWYSPGIRGDCAEGQGHPIARFDRESDAEAAALAVDLAPRLLDEIERLLTQPARPDSGDPP